MTHNQRNRLILRNRAKSRRRKGSPLAPILGFLSAIAFGGILALIVIVVAGGGFAASIAFGTVGALTEGLPSPGVINERETFLTAQIYDREGNLLRELWDPKGGNRKRVGLDKIAPLLIEATLAVEDPGFWENPGVDFRAIGRAALQNLIGTQGPSGASTITMQLARNTLLDAEERAERTLERKAKEALLAIRLSEEFSKDEILEMYLNEIPYGNHSFGIQAAAENYFGKDAADLSLAEASMLAGLPQAPSILNPLVNPDAAKLRQADVLRLMVDNGNLTQSQADAVYAEPLSYVPPVTDLKTAHWTVFIQDYLEKRYGEELYRRGMRIITTLDPRLQQIAEDEVRAGVERNRRYNGNNAALVAIDPKTGQVLAMVGSADYTDASIDGQVNMATSPRQPGSSFKPITYLTSFTKGYSPATVLWDIPSTFEIAGQPDYVPRNFGGSFEGPVAVRSALAGSLNVPAVRVIEFVGVAETIDMAHRLGITDLDRGPANYGLSLTLGGGEVQLIDMVYANSVYANMGRMRGTPVLEEDRRAGFRALDPVYLLTVTDFQGNLIETFGVPEERRIIAPELVYLLVDIISDNAARAPFFGVANSLTLPDRPVAAKTGTTDDSRDNWTLGFTPDLVAGVWIGNADNTELDDTTGSQTAAPIWQAFMKRALEGTRPTPFRRPPNVIDQFVCKHTGTTSVTVRIPPPAAKDGEEKPKGKQKDQKDKAEEEFEGETKVIDLSECPQVREIFAAGYPPTKTTGLEFVQLRIDTRNDKIANDRTPEEFVEEKLFVVLPEGADEETIDPVSGRVFKWDGSEDFPLMPEDDSELRDGDGPIETGIVPNLVGKSEDDAKRLLEESGLRTTYVNYQKRSDIDNPAAYESVPKGHVLSQSIRPGANVAPGTIVLIAVRAE